MSEIIHIAGPVIAFDGTVRQRCAWCGALIDEKRPANMAVAVDPTASEEVQQEEANRVIAGHWEGLVAIDGPVKWCVDDPKDGKAPERSCMRLPAPRDQGLRERVEAEVVWLRSMAGKAKASNAARYLDFAARLDRILLHRAATRGREQR